MRQIFIEVTTYDRLEGHVKTFGDTEDVIINRALDALDQREGNLAPTNRHGMDSERRIDPQQLPDLTHTKVLDATISGTVVARPNWNLLLKKIVELTKKRVRTFDELNRLCPTINLVNGQKEDEGYDYLPDINVSVQGQSATPACLMIVTTAQNLGIALDIGFIWRPKEGAEYPGERGPYPDNCRRILLNGVRQGGSVLTRVCKSAFSRLMRSREYEGSKRRRWLSRGRIRVVRRRKRATI